MMHLAKAFPILAVLVGAASAASACAQPEEYLSSELAVQDDPHPSPARSGRDSRSAAMLVPTLSDGAFDAGPSESAVPPKAEAASECMATCAADHPDGAEAVRVLHLCWNEICSSCATMPPTGSLEPSKTSSCEVEVWTPSSDCSQCTVDWCCEEWDACYTDAECLAFDNCTRACAS